MNCYRQSVLNVPFLLVWAQLSLLVRANVSGSKYRQMAYFHVT